MRQSAAVSTVAIVILLLVACSTPSGSGSSALCRDVRLASAAGTPGQPIVVQGLDEAAGPAALVVSPAAEGEAWSARAMALATRSDGSSSEVGFLTPFHPLHVIAGGEVGLAVAIGSATECDLGTFIIDPLPTAGDPEAEGAFAALVTDLERRLDERSVGERFGTATSEEIDQLLEMMLEVEHDLIRGDDNPNSLIRLASEGRIILDGEAIELDVGALDAIVAHFSGDGAGGQLVSSSMAFPSQTTDRRVEGCVGRAALASATHLDDCMRWRQDLIDDAWHLDAASDVLTSVALLLAADPLPGNEALFGALGVATLAASVTQRIAVRTAPAAIAEMGFEIDTPVIERSTDTGRWTRVDLTVADTPPGEVVDIVKDIFMTLTIDKVLRRVPGPIEKQTRALYDEALERAIGWVLDRVTEKVGAPKVPSVPYASYGPVDITDYRQSYESSVRSDRVIQILSHEEGRYGPTQPLTAGVAQLVLALRKGFFANALEVANRPVAVRDDAGAFLLRTDTRDSPFVMLISTQQSGEIEQRIPLGTWPTGTSVDGAIPITGSVSFATVEHTLHRLTNTVDALTLRGEPDSLVVEARGFNSAAKDALLGDRFYRAHILEGDLRIEREFSLAEAGAVTFSASGSYGQRGQEDEFNDEQSALLAGVEAAAEWRLTIERTDASGTSKVFDETIVPAGSNPSPTRHVALEGGEYRLSAQYTPRAASVYLCWQIVGAPPCRPVAVESPYSLQARLEIVRETD